jgi:hypothetical protein
MNLQNLPPRKTKSIIDFIHSFPNIPLNRDVRGYLATLTNLTRFINILNEKREQGCFLTFILKNVGLLSPIQDNTPHEVIPVLSQLFARNRGNPENWNQGIQHRINCVERDLPNPSSWPLVENGAAVVHFLITNLDSNNSVKAILPFSWSSGVTHNLMKTPWVIADSSSDEVLQRFVSTQGPICGGRAWNCAHGLSEVQNVGLHELGIPILIPGVSSILVGTSSEPLPFDRGGSQYEKLFHELIKNKKMLPNEVKHDS